MSPLDLRLTATTAEHLDTERGVIEGVALLYGQTADASTGRVAFDPGSVYWHPALSRIKLLVDHDPAQPIGYVTMLTETDQALTARFLVPWSPAGIAAVAQAAAGLRDGLSVGATALDYTWTDDDALVVHQAVLREISLCAIPAYDDARLTRAVPHTAA